MNEFAEGLIGSRMNISWDPPSGGEKEECPGSRRILHFGGKVQDPVLILDAPRDCSLGLSDITPGTHADPEGRYRPVLRVGPRIDK
ncbi:MAG: hypothetical protein QCI82_10765 [Candidatus Thermoplasmatota archaeon]|nr:hypothetical protein [Candidatus Thermoplasmatota archaeon]